MGAVFNIAEVGKGGITARATINSNLDQYGAWVEDQAFDRLRLICEAVKVQTQRNISKSSEAFGPSAVGDFPHAASGYLRNSIFWSANRQKMTGTVGTPLLYGLWLEEGTAGGVLVQPTRGKMLSWVDPRSGERRFARHVITSPQGPRSFLRRTLIEMTDAIRKIMARPFEKPPTRLTAAG